jgi:hypothetical protein
MPPMDALRRGPLRISIAMWNAVTNVRLTGQRLRIFYVVLAIEPRLF